MRMIDVEQGHEARNVQLYLSEDEATELRRKLRSLVNDPEANAHFHLVTVDGRDLSCSIVTERKLKDDQYTSLERKVLNAK